MPSVVADEPLLPRFLPNPIADAMMSRRPERPPLVELSAEPDRRFVVTLSARIVRQAA